MNKYEFLKRFGGAADGALGAATVPQTMLQESRQVATQPQPQPQPVQPVQTAQQPSTLGMPVQKQKTFEDTLAEQLDRYGKVFDAFSNLRSNQFDPQKQVLQERWDNTHAPSGFFDSFVNRGYGEWTINPTTGQPEKRLSNNGWGTLGKIAFDTLSDFAGQKKRTDRRNYESYSNERYGSATNPYLRNQASQANLGDRAKAVAMAEMMKFGTEETPAEIAAKKMATYQAMKEQLTNAGVPRSEWRDFGMPEYEPTAEEQLLKQRESLQDIYNNPQTRDDYARIKLAEAGLEPTPENMSAFWKNQGFDTVPTAVQSWQPGQPVPQGYEATSPAEGFDSTLSSIFAVSPITSPINYSLGLLRDYPKLSDEEFKEQYGGAPIDAIFGMFPQIPTVLGWIDNLNKPKLSPKKKQK